MNTEASNPNLGKYRIVDTLGQGRFATVYKVEDTTMGRLAALKLFDAQLMQDEVWTLRLKDTLRNIARLQHPHIIPIYEIDDTSGQCYVVMQFARDGSLAQTIAAHQGQHMPWNKALAFLESVCQALNYAHEQSIAHRDLKPANILIDPPGGPLLSDFELTRLMAENNVGRTRLEGDIIGTLPYVAPEVWESEPAEIPADIYALGCITYEMLIGQRLFAGDTVMQAMHAHAQGPQLPDTWPSDTPAGVKDVLLTALAWDPAARYPTAMAFWHALNKAGEHVSAGAKLAASAAAAAAQWGTKVESALNAGKLQLAKMAVNQWLQAEPNNPEALKARDAVDNQIAAPAPAQPTPAKPAAQPAPKPPPTPSPQPTPAPSAPAAPPAATPAPPTPFTFQTLPDQQTGTLSNQYTVEQFLSTEGQLATYKADINGQTVTLRWFFPPEDTADQRAFVENLIQQGAPATSFLWPNKLVESADAPGFGYIMSARDARFKNIEELVKRWVEPTFSNLITALLNLVEAFTVLHLKGLCFSEISTRNVFFVPDTGEILLTYTDNILPTDTAVTAQAEELRFLAPELIRGEANPGLQTDLYSLATLLFFMLMVHHPLEGERNTNVPLMNRATVQRLYGEDPVFIFDPNNDSNRPVPGYHVSVSDYWPLYPQFIRDLFIRAFTEGISDPYNGRIRASEWRQALVTLRDTIIYCAQCSAENFYDLAVLKTTGKPGVCWSCNADLVLPPRLRIGDHVTILNHNTKLYPHHVDPNRRYDFSQPVAEVTQHPQNPTIWGLKNLSDEKWVITTDDGTIKDVALGRSLTLSAGVKINFGKTEGEIRV